MSAVAAFEMKHAFKTCLCVTHVMLMMTFYR